MPTEAGGASSPVRKPDSDTLATSSLRFIVHPLGPLLMLSRKRPARKPENRPGRRDLARRVAKVDPRAIRANAGKCVIGLRSEAMLIPDEEGLLKKALVGVVTPQPPLSGGLFQQPLINRV